MENKNTGLKVMVIILSLFVVALSGYIVYDKMLSDEDINKENNQHTEDNNDTDSNTNKDQNKEEISIEKIKEIFQFVYNYQEKSIVYCGEVDTNSVQINGVSRKKSIDFTTYDEMFNFLKKYMTTDVIAGKAAFNATTKEYYLEQDGNLYCEETYKGYPYGHGKVDIDIISSDNDKVICIATMELIDMSNTKTYDKVNITLEKDNNNWIITSYDKQN